MKKFQAVIWDHYKKNGRSLPWRNTKDPYRILVSEVMLQQTQVERVKTYYAAFLKKFPNTRVLAKAPLSEVLTLWKGLGYNRRAANLKRAAEEVVRRGSFPKTYTELLDLPGIGPSTAGAIMNFSYGAPTAFIETNIRSVYLHFFFKGKISVSDKEILALVEKTQDIENPHEWYYALYDYGVLLKKTIGNPNTQSKHHKKQSTFKGSNRELRAKMLFYIVEKKSVKREKIAEDLGIPLTAVEKNLAAFAKEGVILKQGKRFKIC